MSVLWCIEIDRTRGRFPRSPWWENRKRPGGLNDPSPFSQKMLNSFGLHHGCVTGLLGFGRTEQADHSQTSGNNGQSAPYSAHNMTLQILEVLDSSKRYLDMQLSFSLQNQCHKRVIRRCQSLPHFVFKFSVFSSGMLFFNPCNL